MRIAPFLGFTAPVAAPAYLLERFGPDPISRGVGRVGRAGATAPYATVLHPKATTGDAWEMGRGFYELGPALKTSIQQHGVVDTFSAMLEGIKQDYAHRYGADWEQAAKEDPLFTLLDVTAFLGAGLRGAALGKAVADLGRLEKPLTIRNVWKESSRPGLISEGTARPRVLEYGGELSSQAYSRSPLRRGFQQLADAAAEKYPDTPMIGASARVARSTNRARAREMERLMGSVSDPHAIEALSAEAGTYLYWAAQINDHSVKGMKQFRKLLGDALETGDLPDDPTFKAVIAEARREGFGKQLLHRLDKAIAANPSEGERYKRAVRSLEDITAVSEETIKDAHGFQNLKGDLKRGQDRLRGMDPTLARAVERLPESGQGWDDFLGSIGDEVLRSAARDVLEPRAKLRALDNMLTEMFRGRRNLVRDWRNRQILKNSSIRQARLDELATRFGREQSEAGIELSDAMAMRFAPDNPERWYEERVGISGGESPEELVASGRIPLWQRQMALETAAEAESGKGAIFYSPLQQGVQNVPWKHVPARQLPGELRKMTSKDELVESGILDWIDALPPDELVTKQQVLDYFANPANAYGIEEVIFSGRSQRWPLQFREVRGLWSKRGPLTDAYQVVFRIPGISRYVGKAQGHWGMNNVIAHMRFLIDESEGKRTMIVEELQSDWLSEFLEGERTFKQLGMWGKPPAGREADYNGLVQRYRDEHMTLLDEEEKLHDKFHDMDSEDPEYEQLSQELHDLDGQIGVSWASFDQAAKDMGVETRHLIGDAEGRTAQAPLSEKAVIRMGVQRMLRWAAEHGVEEIVVPNGNVHRYRYGYEGRTAGGQKTRDFTQELVATYGETMNTHLLNRLYDYGRGVNKEFSKVLGKDGEFSDEAFRGRYADEMETAGAVSEEGGMPGTIFRLTADDRTRFRKPSAAFQRQPDWNGVPKGANELLADGGKNLIHLFERADISTWIHELSHSALHDLPDADLRTLGDHFAGGKLLREWTDAEHENYARTFEAYIRSGKAPMESLRTVFRKLSEWMRLIFQQAEQQEIPINPEVRKVFDSMLTPHEADDVSIFMPHRTAAVNLSGARTSRGIPRARKDIGDAAKSQIPLFAKNRLNLLRTGLINDDPKLAIEHMNRVVMLARANQLREAVMELGKPLMPDEIPDFNTQYVVKRAGRGTNRPLYDAIETADSPDEIRNEIRDFVDNYITDSRTKWEEWRGKEQLYVVDKDYVDKIFKYATGKTPGATTKPETTFTKMADAGLDSIRALLLYLNPGFYTANLIGNATMMGISDPRAGRFLIPSFREAVKAARSPDTADHQWKRISVEMGRGPTSGGLSSRPPLLGREASRSGPVAGRAAESVSLGIGEYGRRTGRIIDDAMRVATWKQVAHKFGYDTEKKIDKLLDDAVGNRKDTSAAVRDKARQDLAAIRDEAEQLMLDFDSMTPFEKTWLTRIIFLYPFLKASAKWPVMYVGERPITADILAQLSAEGSRMTEEQLGPRGPLPEWMQGAARVGPGKYISGGQLSPFAPAVQLLESVLGLPGSPETGISRAFDYVNPLAQFGVELAQGRTQFGQEMKPWEIARQDFPMTALQRQLLHLKGPSSMYSDRSLAGTFLRSLRFMPYGVNEPAVVPEPTRTGGRRRRRRS